MTIAAGQLFRSRAHPKTGRYRYLIVQQVRGGRGGCPYALCQEVTKDGEPVYGKDGNGLSRLDSFTVGISGGELGSGYVAVEG